MALSMTKLFKNESGLEFPVENTYVRVTKLNANKRFIQCEVCYFKSNDDAGPFAVESHLFVPDMADVGENFIKQAYQYLKRLPEFSAATDV